MLRAMGDKQSESLAGLFMIVLGVALICAGLACIVNGEAWCILFFGPLGYFAIKGGWQSMSGTLPPGGPGRLP